MKLIHAHVFDPSLGSIFGGKVPKNRKSAYITIACEKSDSCELYKRGECVLRSIAIGGGTGCPHGEKREEVGYTQRARKSNKWIEEKENLAKGIGELKRPSGEDTRLFSVGDYYLLPDAFTFLDNYENTSHLIDEKIVIKQRFILKEDLKKPEIMKHLISYKPKTAFAGEITRYQKIGVASLLDSIAKFFPELQETVEKAGYNLPEVKSNIGRYALLKTLSPGEVQFDKKFGKWEWDGQVAKKEETAKLGMGLIGVDFERMDITVTPSDNTKVIVLSEDLINEETVFLD